MTKWYVSDTHFSHANIIKFCGRPFASPDKMDEALVTLWNERVKPSDHVTHLGDVVMPWGKYANREAFVSLMRSLNGTKELLSGNHDELPLEWYVEGGFTSVHATSKKGQGNILFSHIPVHPRALEKMVANVHGHIHDSADYPPHSYEAKSGKRVFVPYVNISCEKTDYHPITLDEVVDRVRRATTLAESDWNETHTL